MGVVLEPLEISLVGKVRLIDREIQEEWPIPVPFDEAACLFNHQIGKKARLTAFHRRVVHPRQRDV